jgi:hypothetical protein
MQSVPVLIYKSRRPSGSSVEAADEAQANPVASQLAQSVRTTLGSPLPPAPFILATPSSASRRDPGPTHLHLG